MAAPLTDVGARPAAMFDRIARFLDGCPDLPTPFLVIDLDMVQERYESLRAALPQPAVYFAVKANPDPEIVKLLAALGSSFDVASLGEIELCLRAGIEPSRLSYGNTIKKARDIAAAYARGVRTFAVDSITELDKIRAQCAEGTVLVRISTDGGGADWPLSRKFGCSPAEAEVMLLEAADQGLGIGVSFHVGSQQRDPGAWHAPLAAVADLAASLAQYGHRLSTVNLGGGLPSTHFTATPAIDVYGREIERAVAATLGTDHGMHLMVEPGRFLVGDAGVLRSEVVLITEKATDAGRRWVYLDVGMFNGLTETQDEAIRYRVRCPGTSGELAPAVLAGPTCDSLDVLYEREPYPLPVDLRVGQYVDVLSAGAYTSSYSSVWFNGFEPLRSYHLPPS
ncbi:MAG TPA: type III PLP-dependent enzyme [Jatrophihabitantaceae bacterium]|jgi:ornithine decarboxylase|nr:type III PLP-dependent enzyme [Jatrophihabitantaceae bacterium]